jgi:hypothetical protein
LQKQPHGRKLRLRGRETRTKVCLLNAIRSVKYTWKAGTVGTPLGHSRQKSKIGVGKPHCIAAPLPPNRTGGFPASPFQSSYGCSDFRSGESSCVLMALWVRLVSHDRSAYPKRGSLFTASKLLSIPSPTTPRCPKDRSVLSLWLTFLQP